MNFWKSVTIWYSDHWRAMPLADSCDELRDGRVGMMGWDGQRL